MKGTEIAELERRYLLPQLPDFRQLGTLLYKAPVGLVLQGFELDRSQYDKRSLAVFCFVQPLYVPNDHLWFNFGNRLRDLVSNRDWWEIPETNPEAVMRAIAEVVRVKGLPFLAKYQEPEDLASWKDGLGNPNNLEGVTYSKLLKGDTRSAKKGLAALAKLATAEEVAIRPWVGDIAARAVQVASALENDPETAKALLASWRAETAGNLGLALV
ncbi:MAG: hypothetical protein E6I49_15020 [Chloroflexi bacterium]|nr:MAG: hypothetical protein E6I49_15020 [Chloroflexota bacterium]